MEVPITINIPATEAARFTDAPSSWATKNIEGVAANRILYVDLVVASTGRDAFNPSTHSLWLFADPGRQLGQVGNMRPVWIHQPAYLTAPPDWYLGGPAVQNGLRAWVRLDWPCEGLKTLRVYHTLRDADLQLDGTLVAI